MFAQSLGYTPTYVKGMLRKGAALEALGHYSDALDSFTQANAQGCACLECGPLMNRNQLLFRRQAKRQKLGATSVGARSSWEVGRANLGCNPNHRATL
jgi:hypothetical protein